MAPPSLFEMKRSTSPIVPPRLATAFELSKSGSGCGSGSL